jgi:hypothetical protein
MARKIIKQLDVAQPEVLVKEVADSGSTVFTKNDKKLEVVNFSNTYYTLISLGWSKGE